MVELLKLFLRSLFGIVLVYSGAFAMEESVKYVEHFTSFPQFLFGLVVIGLGLYLVAYSVYVAIENKDK